MKALHQQHPRTPCSGPPCGPAGTSDRTWTEDSPEEPVSSRSGCCSCMCPGEGVSEAVRCCRCCVCVCVGRRVYNPGGLTRGRARASGHRAWQSSKGGGTWSRSAGTRVSAPGVRGQRRRPPLRPQPGNKALSAAAGSAAIRCGPTEPEPQNRSELGSESSRLFKRLGCGGCARVVHTPRLEWMSSFV